MTEIPQKKIESFFQYKIKKMVHIIKSVTTCYDGNTSTTQGTHGWREDSKVAYDDAKNTVKILNERHSSIQHSLVSVPNAELGNFTSNM